MQYAKILQGLPKPTQGGAAAEAAKATQEINLQEYMQKMIRSMHDKIYFCPESERDNLVCF